MFSRCTEFLLVGTSETLALAGDQFYNFVETNMTKK